MKVFKVTTKRKKRVNGTAKDVAETYVRIYGYDYKKACCNAGDFEY